MSQSGNKFRHYAVYIMTLFGKNADQKRFEKLFLPHLTAAYNLARWLLHDPSAAEDVVQESYLRAFNAQQHFKDGNEKAWLLTIVRNQSYSWLTANKTNITIDIYDESLMSEEDLRSLSHSASPEKLIITQQSAALLLQELELLPMLLKEVIVLKELEGLSYKEIANIIGAPIGTVMSRLARARETLKNKLLADK